MKEKWATTPRTGGNTKKQTPILLIRNMADERDVSWLEVLERAGESPPWTWHVTTDLFKWLKPMKKYSDDQKDAKRRSKQRTGDGDILSAGQVIAGLAGSGE